MKPCKLQKPTIARVLNLNLQARNPYMLFRTAGNLLCRQIRLYGRETRVLREVRRIRLQTAETEYLRASFAFKYYIGYDAIRNKLKVINLNPQDEEWDNGKQTQRSGYEDQRNNDVRFGIPTVVTMKCPRFWILTPCSLVKSIDVPEEGIASIFRIEGKPKQDTRKNGRRVHPGDEGDMFPRNV
jgi:hypothetical protein